MEVNKNIGNTNRRLLSMNIRIFLKLEVNKRPLIAKIKPNNDQ